MYFPEILNKWTYGQNGFYLDKIQSEDKVDNREDTASVTHHKYFALRIRFTRLTMDLFMYKDIYS